MSADDNSKLPAIWSHLNIPSFIAGPAGAALSRLIGKAVDIPGAALEARAQRIKDKTDAESTVTKALAEAVAARAVADHQLVDRAMEAFVNKELRKQANKEAVGQKTIELLAEEPPPGNDQPKSAAPDEDWMNMFESYAENASTERMRDTWARVLAGEIRKPQSFSLKTLSFISQLDQRIATLFERYASWVTLNNAIPKQDELSGALLADLLALEEFGLIAGVHGFIAKTISILPEQRGHLLALGDKHVVLIKKADITTKIDIRIPSMLLTTVGSEIFAILKPQFDLAVARRVAEIVPKDQLERIAVFNSPARTEGEALWQRTKH